MKSIAFYLIRSNYHPSQNTVRNSDPDLNNCELKLNGNKGVKIGHEMFGVNLATKKTLVLESSYVTSNIVQTQGCAKVRENVASGSCDSGTITDLYVQHWNVKANEGFELGMRLCD